MMKRKNDHIKLLEKRSEQPGWKKALRFLLRLAMVAVILLLIRQGETFFRINEIEVRGAGELTAAEIISAGKVSRGMSIILLREERIAEKIQHKYPRVKSVEINRILPDKVTIIIDERRPVGSIITADGFWLMDSNTIPFTYTAEPADGYPLISGIEGELVMPGFPLGCPVKRGTLSNFFAAWVGESRLEIEKIDMTDSYNLVVYTEGGLEIWFGDGKRMEHKLDLVELSMPHIALDSKTRLDVRSGNRLVLSSAAVIDQKGVDP